MSEKIRQDYAHHTKWDPPFHFFLLPVAAIVLIGVLWNLVTHPVDLAAWWHLLIVAAGIVFLFKARIYALRVQDRVIRLEERLRLAALLPPPLKERIGELTVDQLIGLRFASDAELPALVEKILQNKMTRDEIKKVIENWRPDHWRV